MFNVLEYARIIFSEGSHTYHIERVSYGHAQSEVGHRHEGGGYLVFGQRLVVSKRAEQIEAFVHKIEGNQSLEKWSQRETLKRLSQTILREINVLDSGHEHGNETCVQDGLKLFEI